MTAVVVTVLLMLVGVPALGSLFSVALAVAGWFLLKDRREATVEEE